MNIDQAKQIPIEDLLGRLGYQPAHNRHGQLWYLSPLRDEKTPSFKVNPLMNAWYDFGEGQGGDVVDLVMRLERPNSISAALARIEAIVGAEPLPPRSTTAPIPAGTPRALELTSVGPVTSKSLRAYLSNRGIRPAAVADFINEAHYRRGDSSYFALAFANDSGGYELRSPAFKGTIGTKDITTWKGNPDHVVVFEGFFDFLSSIMMHGGMPDATVIVLNSVAMRDKAIATIQGLGSKTVELYRDRDDAGEQLLKRFREALPNTAIIDKSNCYAAHDDLNDWFAANGKSSSYIS